MARIDLHLHSRCSDGVHSPAWVIQQAAAHGAELVALSDHDTLAGVASAREAGREFGVAVIAGVEISVNDPQFGELHMLGYLAPSAPLDDLEQQLSAYRHERRGRANRTVDLLRQLGAPVEESAVLRFARGGVVGRPHIARALLEAGHVTSVQDAFDRYLHDDGPAYVPRAVLSLRESLALIHAAGGFAALAHPSRYQESVAVVKAFAQAGGDGVEIYYRNDSLEQVARGEQLARRLGLVPTVGTDFHGLHEYERRPATTAVPDRVADQLIEVMKDLAA